jgi:hypothetical protein
MKKATKTVEEFLFKESEINKVKANENFQPWGPTTEVAPSEPTIISYRAVKRDAKDEDDKPIQVDDVLIMFKVSGITCKTYASVIKGIVKSRFGIDAFIKAGKGFMKLIGGLSVGYEKNTGPKAAQYPTRMKIVVER